MNPVLVNVAPDIYLVGTAHVSKKSVEEAVAAIRELRPAVVAVELDRRRRDALLRKTKWEEMPVEKLLEGRRGYLFLAQAFLSSIQRRLGEEFGSEPGSEFLAAMKAAEETKSEVALVDRDITTTLKRAWRTMSLREKMRVLWYGMKAIFTVGGEDDGKGKEKEKKIDLDEMMKEDVLSMMLNELRALAPSAAKVLIDERDAYMAMKIVECAKRGRVVAVVGAGHVAGLRKQIRRVLDHRRMPPEKALNAIPPKSGEWGKVVGYSMLAFFVLFVAWLVLHGKWKEALDAFLAWFLIHGALAALGALLARGHPFSAGAAFLVAWWTPFHPLLAAGWFSGYVEIKMRKPTVGDLKAVTELKFDTWRTFFGNKVIRVLFVASFTNLGTVAANFIAGTYLIRMGLG